MISIEERFFEDFIETAHAIGRGYTLCSSGNLSIRVDDHLCLVSTAGSWLGKMKKEQIAVCNYKTGEALNGLKPSTEHNIHFGLLNARPDVNAIIHSQPMFATTIACSQVRPTNYNITAELPCYIGEVMEIPYTRPGSVDLAKKVVEALAQNHLALLLNHGIVAVGPTSAEAYQRTCFFEMACQVIIQTGGKYNLLTHQELKDIDQYILGKKG
jgi:ribulose-5-phosphate 4-epimerase/fuculose-1-phosphate aldolase